MIGSRAHDDISFLRNGRLDIVYQRSSERLQNTLTAVVFRRYIIFFYAGRELAEESGDTTFSSVTNDLLTNNRAHQNNKF